MKTKRTYIPTPQELSKILKATPHILLPSKRNMKKPSAESRVHIVMFNFMFTWRTESD